MYPDTRCGGSNEDWGNVVEQVSVLAVHEQVTLNSKSLAQLYRQLGENNAEEVVCRAMEELALRLANAERVFRAGDLLDLRKCVRSMRGIADQIGMSSLRNVAQDVTICIDNKDSIALSATMARLIRIGERSLTEIWTAQDLSL